MTCSSPFSSQAGFLTRSGVSSDAPGLGREAGGQLLPAPPLQRNSSFDLLALSFCYWHPFDESYQNITIASFFTPIQERSKGMLAC